MAAKTHQPDAEEDVEDSVVETDVDVVEDVEDVDVVIRKKEELGFP